LAQNGWSIVNPDNSTTWEIATVAGTVSGDKAARVNIFNYNAAGQRDGLVSPTLDFSGHNNVQLDFQHAHRRRAQNFSDSLIVYVSTNGGVTYPNRVLAIAETGTGSFATGTILNTNFIPANGNDWCFGGDVGSGCFTVDLSDFDGQNNIKLKFETYNATGNNIYLDNIRLSGNCVLVAAQPVAAFGTNTTEVCVGQTVQFFDQSANVPSTYSWSFPGGTPATSSLPAPQVVYSEPGVYSVSLSVSNSFGTDALTLNDYVSVNQSPNLVVDAPVVVSCSGQPVVIGASGADLYSWSPATGLSSTTDATVEANPSASLTYTVTGTSFGCSVQAQIDVTISPTPAAPVVVSQNNTAFVVTQPASVQGHYDYLANAAGWGNQAFASISVEAPLIIARTSAVDSALCAAAFNAAQVAGKIAVVYRGGCEFGVKALNAQNAGAVGVIVVNNDDSPILEMGPGASGQNVTIPAIMVTNTTGAWLNSQINAGVAVARLGQFNGGALILCPGESAQISAPGGFGEYLWNTGFDGPILTITQPGTYSVSIFNEVGCSSASANVPVSSYTVNAPVISLNGNVLESNVNAQQYQWYLNGELIDGATGATTPVIGEGLYTVAVVYLSGCSSESEPYEVGITAVNSLEASTLSAYPVPSRDWVRVLLPKGLKPTVVRLYTTGGKLVSVDNNPVFNNANFEFDLSELAAGSYVLQIESSERPYHVKVVKQ
jgi:PKD repeat protein